MRERFEFFNTFADEAKRFGMTPMVGSQVCQFPVAYATFWSDTWIVSHVIQALQSTDETRLKLSFARGGWNENEKTTFKFDWKDGAWVNQLGQRFSNQELCDWFFDLLQNRAA